MQEDQAHDLQEVVVEVVLLLWVGAVEGHALKVGVVELVIHVLEEVEVAELHEGEGEAVVLHEGEEVAVQAFLVLEVVEEAVHQEHKEEEAVEHYAVEEEEVEVEFDGSEKEKKLHKWEVEVEGVVLHEEVEVVVHHVKEEVGVEVVVHHMRAVVVEVEVVVVVHHVKEVGVEVVAHHVNEKKEPHAWKVVAEEVEVVEEGKENLILL